MSHEIIQINMAEMAVGSHGTIIQTSSLGSCVAIVLHERFAEVGGMAHAMLPSRNMGRQVSLEDQDTDGNMSVAKYADEAVDRLVRELEKIGAKKENMRAKLVGGAKMFRVLSNDDKGIGFRNAEASRIRLMSFGIPVESEDIGGTAGRSVEFNISTGLVEITTVI